MNTNTLADLDYYRIRDTVAGCCCAQESAELLKTREPLTDSAQIRLLKQQGAEWSAYIQSGREAALCGWEPVHDILERLAVMGTVLSPTELYALGRFCRIAETARRRLSAAHAAGLSVTAIAGAAAEMPDTAAVERDIFRIIDADGTLRDLPELCEIRERIKRIRGDIEAVMRRYTSDSSLHGVLQSSVPALRAGRQVLAVRSGQRGKIRGIIHEVSQTGQTVYIEPEEAVRRSNDLVEEQARLEQETRRILRELTARIAPHADMLSAVYTALTALDMSYAAARWGALTRGVFAADCTAGEAGTLQPPAVKQARHPLFGEQAVPIDITFADGCRVLIITGPNTGGKTAAIKTFALFALLNQSGFPVPAAEGTRLPVFTGVFADIGDAQSLEASLSTFSGHMKNISQALAGADARSLVLLDELGSGTDPQEGSAIAMAVLDALLERGSFVLATTHHGVLKNYGYTHACCQNASVEFDAEALVPLYRVLPGIPGESRALEIARRSGIPESVVERARALIGGGSADISALIAGLSQKHRELDALSAQTAEREARAASREAQALQKELSYREKELALQKTGAADTRHFIEESRRMLENLVRELREGEITREKTKAVKQFISGMNEYEAALSASLAEKEAALEHSSEAAAARAAERSVHAGKKKKRLKNAAALVAAYAAVPERELREQCAPQALAAGAVVSLKQAGRTQRGVAERREKNGSWLVRFGSVKMSVPAERLIVVNEAPNAESAPSVSVELAGSAADKAPEKNGVPSGGAPVFELRLLGMRREEALAALERQLDLAVIQGLKSFSIIHGKGTGALQTAVHDYLRTYPGVADFGFAPPEDGGTGKTYVSLV